MYRRRRLDEEEDSHDRWLISYADFITLLFAFFVVMYATSTINLNKYRALSDAVVTAFQGKPGQALPADLQTPALQGQGSVLKPLPLSHLYQEKKLRDQEKLRALGQQLANILEAWIEQKLVVVQQGERGIDIEMQNTLLFHTDQATLSADGAAVIHTLGNQLKNEYRTLQVEAHTDRHMFDGQSEADTKRWELTAMQAARVAAALNAQGIANKRLSATGLSDTKPASSSDNALARAINSRVIIRILSAEAGAQQTSNSANLTEILPAAETDNPLPPAEIPTVTPSLSPVLPAGKT